jgi:TfoX/Sxy family transcriptional regulator of competence genes
MKWSKSPPELIEAFHAILPGPPVERRQMFGYPAAFLNGNMVCGLFQNGMVLRLDENSSSQLLKIKGASAFSPVKGRKMSGFVFVEQSLAMDEDAITPWLEAALNHVGRMPPKKKAAKKAPPRSAKKAPAKSAKKPPAKSAKKPSKRRK